MKGISMRALSLASLATAEKAKRKYAYKRIPGLNGMELLQFASLVASRRGWGKGLAKAINRWYTSRSQAAVLDEVQFCSEFRGWTHGKLIACCHLAPIPEHRETFRKLKEAIC